MATDPDQIGDLARKSQDALSSLIHSWTETIQSFTGGLSGAQSRPPDVQRIVDSVFDFAEQLLANQREFTKSLLAAGAQTGEAMTRQAVGATRSVTAEAANSTQAAADNAGRAAESMAEQAPSVIRPAQTRPRREPSG